MTVSEAIELLQQMPPDCQLVVPSRLKLVEDKGEPRWRASWIGAEEVVQVDEHKVRIW